MHEPVNYKKKYKSMKKKLRFIVYEQECFLEELRKAQRRLMKVSRDRSFLLDRLLQYEKLDTASTDSDATVSSDSENETGLPSSRRKKSVAGATSSGSGLLTTIPSLLPITQGSTSKLPLAVSAVAAAAKRAKVNKKLQKTVLQTSPPGMTREELERHLELKQSNKPTFMSLEKTPYDLPDDIFSEDKA